MSSSAGDLPAYGEGASFTPAETARRRFLLRATLGVGGACSLAALYPFIASFEPSARARAEGAPVETDIGGILPGGLYTVPWRGKPVWVLHRTPQMIASLASDQALLADPDSKNSDQQPKYCVNQGRSIKPEWFVCVGICTHLGCSPTLREGAGELGPDWPGGFFCPCHGSKFDLAGRVFHNVPAPANLVIPPYSFLSPTRIRIGEDAETKV
ncbi:MAG TPA: ubiquinol-cytochrome c reductase iron-sulfur subunit [Rhodocyclaceae bacterium]